MLQAIVPIAAPITPISGIGTNTILIINFAITPTVKAIAGTITFPKPCNAPLIVCARTVKIIANELICSKRVPEDCAGNNSFNIGSANIYIPTVQGSPINIVTKIEKLTLLLAVVISFLALAYERAGTSAVANAMLKDSGNDVNVSTFPLNIPYCILAAPSSIKFLSPLTTVVESIFLLIEDKIALSEIGIDTLSMFFITLNILSFPCRNSY